MINKKLYQILGENKDLGNKLHAYYVYKCSKQKQVKIKKTIDKLIHDYSDKQFKELAYDNTTKTLINELIALKNEHNWMKIILKLLKGLSHLLKREIGHAEKLQKPDNIRKYVEKEIKKLHIYHKSDIIKVKEKGDVVEVDYLSRRFSPEYNPDKKSCYNRFEPWRDTQFIFTLNFSKNLFIWDYINVHKSFWGKRIGTKAAKFVERLAKDLGFKRFSVEYPNRKYWMRKMGYKIPYGYRIGSGKCQYTHEGYKHE